MNHEEHIVKLEMERHLKTLPLTENTSVFHDEIIYNGNPIVISEGIIKNENLNLDDYSIKGIGSFRFVTKDFLEKWRTDIAFLPAIQFLPYQFVESNPGYIPVIYLKDDLYGPEGNVYPKMTSFSFTDKVNDEKFHLDAVFNFLKDNQNQFKNIKKHKYWKTVSNKNHYLEFDWIPLLNEYEKYIKLRDDESSDSLNEIYKILGIDKFLKYDPLTELKKASK